MGRSHFFLGVFTTGAIALGMASCAASSVGSGTAQPMFVAAPAPAPLQVGQVQVDTTVASQLQADAQRDGLWHCNWFANRSLLGAPVLSSTLASVDFNWGRTAPIASATNDGFSMRCVSWQRLTGPDNHRFDIQARGGVRFFVNDQLINIDDWRAGKKQIANDIGIATEQPYRLTLEYYAVNEPASLSLSHSVGTYSSWRAQYFNTNNRTGPIALQANNGDHNGDLVLDWGSGAPAGVNADNFSAIWEQQLQTKGGTYRFWGNADDELKIYVDHALVYDNGGHAGPFDFQVPLRRGFHLTEVHYADYTGDARMVLHWERVSQ